MKKLASVLIILILLISVVVVFAQTDTVSGIQGIARSDSGLYAAVGYDGFIITSDDGVTWNKRTAPVKEKLNGIVWAMGKFVAVGDKGTILTSNDGIDWTKAEIDGEVDIYGAASSGKEFIAAGYDGTILVSKDGEKWVQRRMATAEGIYRVRWVNDRYIAVGGGMLILTSEDGITWDTIKSQPSSTTMFTDVAWNGEKYVVVGDHLSIWLSDDGITFTQDEKVEPLLIQEGMDISECIYSVVWTGNKFFAAGHGGNILSSPDGHSWSNVTKVTRRILKDTIYSQDKFVVVGDEGTILNSEDGVNWTKLGNISAEPDKMSLKAGESKPLKITLGYPFGDVIDATGTALYEVIGGDDILTVENDGTMKAVSEGQALVRATYDFKSVEILVDIEPEDNALADKEPQVPGEVDNKKDNSSINLSYIFLVAGVIIAVSALVSIVLFNTRNRAKNKKSKNMGNKK